MTDSLAARPTHRRPVRVTSGDQREPQTRWGRRLYGAVEVVVLALVGTSPWAFGCVHPFFEMLLLAGVALALLLWAAAVLVEWELTWKPCPVALVLFGLVLFGLAQMLPLPRPLLEWLSPAAADWHARLVPAVPEALPGGERAGHLPLASGSALSLYPGATRGLVLHLLTITLLFAVVRNTYASRGSLRRLGVVCLVNGSLLSFFALVQFFSSPTSQVYWTFETAGQVYGPFICRNHFPFYVNMCFALTVGLLLAGLPRKQEGESFQFADLLQKPVTLWQVAGLALMGSAAVFSLSRGGILVLLLATLLCVGFHWWRYRDEVRWQPWLVIGLLGFGLLAWFGLPQVERRLATLLQGEALEQSRLYIWRPILPRVADFPLWGSGYGTFSCLESMGRQPGDNPNIDNEFAHNEYLEALLEGGLVRLGLTLALIGWLLRLGHRAFLRYEETTAGGLVFGAVLGLLTVALHSSVDFGLHIPAIAVLAAVLAAHVATLGAARGPVPPQAPDNGRSRLSEGTLRLRGAAPALGALALVALALLLFVEGRQAWSAERFRLAARERGRQDTPADRQRQIEYLEAAVRLAPGDARLRLDLGEAYRRAYHEEAQRFKICQRDAGYASGVGLLASAGPAGLSAITAAFSGSEDPTSPEQPLPVTPELHEALRHYLSARQLNPFLDRVHVRLAAYADVLTGADKRVTYLERATWLRPIDPELWYLRGQAELQAGDHTAAWSSWRRSLELSPRFLDPVVAAAREHLPPADMVAQLLPARPAHLMRAADSLGPDAGTEDRKPFLDSALAAFGTQRGGLTAADFFLKGQIYQELGRPAEALAAYRLALAREDNHPDWRFRLAQLLDEQGRLQEACDEMRRVVQDQRGNVEAKELLDDLLRRLTEQGR